jgi:hypothetical protein
MKVGPGFCPGSHCKILVDDISGYISMLDVHPTAKYSILFLDHSKPSGTKNLASNNRLF